MEGTRWSLLQARILQRLQLAQAVRRVARGERDRVSGPAVTRELGLTDLDEAFRAMLAGEVIRSVVVF